MDEIEVRPMKVEINKRERVFDGFFKIDKLTTTHELHRGGTLTKPWLIFERGDAVAVVLYKSDSQEIILVRQFRAPTLNYDETDDGFRLSNDGQLDETIAGMHEPGESDEECAIRETREETGYIIKPGKLELISRFFTSPGGTSERIFLYYAVVTDADRDPSFNQTTAGVAEDDEDILVRHIPVSTFFSQMVLPTETIDAKVLIAALLLRDRIGKIPETEMRQPAKGEPVRFCFEKDRSREIVLRSGDIMGIKDVDAWVNSENTDMEMDRFIGRTISGKLRYAGAVKDERNRVLDDTIANALRKRMRGRNSSRIGTVHNTTSGELLVTHNVKRLFHVAAVEGIAGTGPRCRPEQVPLVVKNALVAIDRRNAGLMTVKCASALLPMIGTGDGGLDVEISFPLILDGILAFLKENDQSSLSQIHVCAYTRHDAAFALAHLDKQGELERSVA